MMMKPTACWIILTASHGRFEQMRISGKVPLFLICCIGLISSAGTVSQSQNSIFDLQQDDGRGNLRVQINGCEAFTYQYTSWYDLPHIWPLRSPSGKNMLEQQNEPYPHHRAFYFADTVLFNGARKVDVYMALYTGQKIGTDVFGPPFRDHIRHTDFKQLKIEEDRAIIEAELLWEMDGNKPVLDDLRLFDVFSLGNGEYLIDVLYTLTASYGDIEFISDEVHYAWPFLRLDPIYSGDNGGTITADTGTTGQEATNLKIALWIDYSNSVEGTTEGLAVFQWPSGKPHRWLTREYGIFGPRRSDEQSGHPFSLKRGESITQRVGILIHKGDVSTGRVAERYKQYIDGRWDR
jgi:hypothetical protein